MLAVANEYLPGAGRVLRESSSKPDTEHSGVYSQELHREYSRGDNCTETIPSTNSMNQNHPPVAPREKPTEYSEEYSIKVNYPGLPTSPYLTLTAAQHAPGTGYGPRVSVTLPVHVKCEHVARQLEGLVSWEPRAMHHPPGYSAFAWRAPPRCGVAAARKV